MKKIYAAVAAFVFLPASTVEGSETDKVCPVSLPTADLLGHPFPESDHWYGSEALAVPLPNFGVWGITGETALIAVKLFWRSVAFDPKKTSELVVTVEPLHGQFNDVVVSPTTTAFTLDGSHGSFLTGIDFPSPGCWEITGTYLGQELSFVVETVTQSRFKEILADRERSSANE